MEIDPSLQLALFVSAFLSGFLLGAVFELLQVLKILLGAYRPPACMRARYERPLPILRRGVPFEKKGGRMPLRAFAAGVLDCFFCIAFAAVQVILLYAYNDGAIRLSVPVLALGGFALFHLPVAAALRLPRAYLAYALSAAWLYVTGALLWLWRVLRALVRRTLLRPLQGLLGGVCALAARRKKKKCPGQGRKKRKEGIDHGKKEIRR